MVPVSSGKCRPNIVTLGSDVASLILSYLTEQEIVVLLSAAKEVGSFTGVVAQYGRQPCVRCNDGLSAFSNAVCECNCAHPAALASLTTLHISPMRLSVRAFMAHRVMPVEWGHTLTPLAVDFVTSHTCIECRQQLALCYNTMLCKDCMQNKLRIVSYSRTELQRLYAPFGTRAQGRQIVNGVVHVGEKRVYWAEIVSRLEQKYGSSRGLAQHILSLAKLDRMTLFISFLRTPTAVHRYLFQQYLPTLLSTRADSSAIIKTLKNGSLDLSLFQSVPQPQLIMTLPMLQFPKTCLYLLSQHRTVDALKANTMVQSAWPIAKAYSNLTQLILRSFCIVGASPTHQLARVCSWIILMESVEQRFFVTVASGACTPRMLDETVLNIQVSANKLHLLLVQYVSGECPLQTVAQFKIDVEGGCFDNSRLARVWEWAIKILSNYWTPPGVAPVQRLHRLLWAVQLASMWHDACPFLLNTQKVCASSRAGTPVKKGFLHFNPSTKVGSSVCLNPKP